jgi:ribokinase
MSTSADRGGRRATDALVVLGSINMDIVVPTPHIPRPGETVLAGDARYLPGGKGANQAVAAARLGGEVAMIGRTGDDDFGHRMLTNLRAVGVRVEHVRALPGAASGIALVSVADQGENAIIVSPGANARLTPRDLDDHESAIAGSRVAITQLEIPLETAVRFAELCQAHGVELILNAAPCRDLPAGLLRRCAYLVVNQEEAAALTGVPVDGRAGARRALAVARERGARTVIMTLGGEGCVALSGDGYLEVAAYQVPVVDSTGAGDAFVGALGVALARGQALGPALTFATAAGAVACRGVGAQHPGLTQGEVAALIAGNPPGVRREVTC